MTKLSLIKIVTLRTATSLKLISHKIPIILTAIIINSFFFFVFPLIHYYKSPDRYNNQKDRLNKIKLSAFKIQKKKKKIKREKTDRKKAKQVTKIKRPDRFKLKLGMAGGTGAGVLDNSTKNIIYEKGEVDTPPIKISGRQVTYPAAAQAAGIKGRVELKIVVSENGHVTSVEVVEKKSTEGYGFREACINTVWGYRFKPAKFNNIPVECRVLLTFNFY